MDQNKNGKKLLTPTRLAFTALVLSLIAMFGVSSCNSNDSTSPTTPTTKPASPSTNARNNVSAGLNTLPPNVLDAQLRAASGPSIKLSDYSGKVLLVNLWATWCGPCRNEIPELVKLNKEFQSRGVEIVGLSTENPEASAESVKAFVRDYNIDYKIGWATPEVAVTLMQGRESIPQSFIISREGRIMKRFIGFSPAILPQLRQALEDALAAKG
jgi:peroxiredoxin